MWLESSPYDGAFPPHSLVAMSEKYRFESFRSEYSSVVHPFTDITPLLVGFVRVFFVPR